MSPTAVAFLGIGLAMLAGVTTAIQPAINARFGSLMPSRLHGSVVNFVTGLAAMLIVCLIVRTPLPKAEALARAPWWSWLGGLCGAFFVTMAIMLVPRLGAAAYLTAMVAGMMIGSLVIDHFGMLGLDVRAVTPGRIMGIVLILAGVGCVRFL